MTERKNSGQEWFPPNHFRPTVNWRLDDGEMEDFRAWILGPLYQMAALMVHEQRAHLAVMNGIGELCAQFSSGVLALIREAGADAVLKTVAAYHKLHPAAANSPWRPEVLEHMGGTEWQQLYVNAEHNGAVGVITIGRESYNWHVNAELNRAIDWLKRQKINRVIVTGDFHLAGQLVGADTSCFYPAFDDPAKGVEVSRSWSRTARRLHDEFSTSIGFINGKRCFGGMLELLEHCHYVVAVESAELGMPEVTLPVVPGMEGCHWIFRKTARQAWPRLLHLLLDGKPIKAPEGVGWLIDYAGPMADALKTCWALAQGRAGISRRALVEQKLEGVTSVLSDVNPGGPGVEAARQAILRTIEASCGATLAEALEIQAELSGEFMGSLAFRNGRIGEAYGKMKV